MTKPQSEVIGKWRIFEADLWDASDLDLVEPAYIRFDPDGRGEFMFICVSATMDCGYSPNGADFDFRGFDEMDETSRSGDADLDDDGILTIVINFFIGDRSNPEGTPMVRFSTAC